MSSLFLGPPAASLRNPLQHLLQKLKKQSIHREKEEADSSTFLLDFKSLRSGKAGFSSCEINFTLFRSIRAVGMTAVFLGNQRNGQGEFT